MMDDDKRVLVIGAGIGGMKAALDLADRGCGVTLVEKAPYPGGMLSRLDYQFPTNHCGMCRMLPLFDRDEESQRCLRRGLAHPNIDLLTSAELIRLEGQPGNFKAAISRKSGFVDPDRCIGCGECARVCPEEAPDEFNFGLATRKAVYRPSPHAPDAPFRIDAAVCTWCGMCESVCPTDAIRLAAHGKEGFRVLVVDDEKIVRESLRDWLEMEGFQADVAGSGQEAVRALEEQTYGLMMLDIKMVDMDGVDTLKTAREIRPELRTVMMTAYATVETAVETMKIGAIDYLVKPFEPEEMIRLVNRAHRDFEAETATVVKADAVIFSGGVDYETSKDALSSYGYGLLPGVLTSLEFERLLSGTGPGPGFWPPSLAGPGTRKIAWIQCVGSRNPAIGSDYCSSVCCMYALKQAMIAREKLGARFETAIFYMDLRTPGNHNQKYAELAAESGVRLERARIHSVEPGQSGGLILRWTRSPGVQAEETFDALVLSIGQKPSLDLTLLAEGLGVELNEWGFAATQPFSRSKTALDGIFIGGSFSGLRDIRHSVIQAGSAALNASRSIRHSADGFGKSGRDPKKPAALTAAPRILVSVCSCGSKFDDFVNREVMCRRLMNDPEIADVVSVDVCGPSGFETLLKTARELSANRVLIGACQPFCRSGKAAQFAAMLELPAMHVISDNLLGLALGGKGDLKPRTTGMAVSELKDALVRLKEADYPSSPEHPSSGRALVVGGGIAGMTAALALADHGCGVVLIEKEDRLGGNLNWLATGLGGEDFRQLLNETLSAVENHPRVKTMLNTRIMKITGEAGSFITGVMEKDGAASAVEHAAVILATGGKEAPVKSRFSGFGQGLLSQRELETKLNEGSLDPSGLKTVVMIQCVDSREGDRNYCSSVCCPTSIKHALRLKSLNPGLDIFIFYRDMMTCGFDEHYYTQARQAGVIFIPYETGRKPEIRADGGRLTVEAWEPVIGRQVAVDADLAVLAGGVEPESPAMVFSGYGAEKDAFGFFEPADPKWRPVASLTEGVFACGLVLEPCPVKDAIASAEAAASDALHLMSRETIKPSRITAFVRHALCARCLNCLDACAYGARRFDEELEQIVVHPGTCQGCGACAAVCPSSAAVLNGFSDRVMMGRINAMLARWDDDCAA